MLKNQKGNLGLDNQLIYEQCLIGELDNKLHVISTLLKNNHYFTFVFLYHWKLFFILLNSYFSEAQVLFFDSVFFLCILLTTYFQIPRNLSLPGGFKLGGFGNEYCDVITATGWIYYVFMPPFLVKKHLHLPLFWRHICCDIIVLQ